MLLFFVADNLITQKKIQKLLHIRFDKFSVYMILAMWASSYQFIRNKFTPYNQAFIFMVGLGHNNKCPMISKYGPSLSKAVGPVDSSILVMKKSHFNKNVHLTVSLQKVQVGCQYSKTGLKQPLKKDKTKILIKNGSLMKVERIAECSPPPRGAFCNPFDLH